MKALIINSVDNQEFNCEERQMENMPNIGTMIHVDCINKDLMIISMSMNFQNDTAYIFVKEV